jgi:hypothetical protein
MILLTLLTTEKINKCKIKIANFALFWCW